MIEDLLSPEAVRRRGLFDRGRGQAEHRLPTRPATRTTLCACGLCSPWRSGNGPSWTRTRESARTAGRRHPRVSRSAWGPRAPPRTRRSERPRRPARRPVSTALRRRLCAYRPFGRAAQEHGFSVGVLNHFRSGDGDALVIGACAGTRGATGGPCVVPGRESSTTTTHAGPPFSPRRWRCATRPPQPSSPSTAESSSHSCAAESLASRG